MTEDKSHNIKHKSNKPHLVQDSAWLSWKWYVQKQESVWPTHQPCGHILIHWDQSLNAGRNGIKMTEHERMKS